MRAALIGALLFALPAMAADYTAINTAAAQRHIVPAYEKLAGATATLARQAQLSCTDVAALQRDWRGAMTAWQGAQHLRFGPIEWFNRLQRFAFWPDPRNTTARQLNELFQKQRMPEDIVMGSVAVQGLSALERVLFDQKEAAKLSTEPFRCTWLKAVAANLATMAGDALTDWRDPPRQFAQQFGAGKGADLTYASAQEGTLDLFKSLYTAVELAADHKLARPLGDKVENARPTAAESSRSGQSLANIRENLKAAAALYDVMAEGVADAALRADIANRLNAALATAQGISGTLESAVADRAQRSKLEGLRRDLQALKSLLADKLTVALDLPLGFNALDGD
jgi:predicted lipoprotein